MKEGPVCAGPLSRHDHVTAVITVAVLAVIAPYLLNVELPQGVVGDWLIDKLALRAG